tara:strand:- start:194 stop:379 length:186 start_codon:yes stop_codon:yes gene_type:complete
MKDDEARLLDFILDLEKEKPLFIKKLIGILITRLMNPASARDVACTIQAFVQKDEKYEAGK